MLETSLNDLKATLKAEFIDVEDAVELHFGHTKKNKEGKNLTDRELGLLSLDNFIYYCKKWGVPKQRAIEVAKSWRVTNPEKYVIRRWMSI